MLTSVALHFLKRGQKKFQLSFFDKIVKSHVGVACFIIFFTVNDHIDNVYIIYFILKVNSIFLFYYRVSLYLEKIRFFFIKRTYCRSFSSSTRP